MRIALLLALPAFGSAFGLSACVGVTTETARQSAYAALSDYDGALAAADAYLCVNEGELSQPCRPRPDCGATPAAPAAAPSVPGCVVPRVRQALQTTVAQGAPVLSAARLLTVQASLTADDQVRLAKLAALLASLTATLRVQVATGQPAAAAPAVSSSPSAGAGPAGLSGVEG